MTGTGGVRFLWSFFGQSRQSWWLKLMFKMSIRRFVFDCFFIYLERSVSAWSCIGLIRKLCPCLKLWLIYSFNQRQLARVVDKQGSQFIISVEVWSLFIYCIHVQIFFSPSTRSKKYWEWKKKRKCGKINFCSRRWTRACS